MNVAFDLHQRQDTNKHQRAHQVVYVVGDGLYTHGGMIGAALMFVDAEVSQSLRYWQTVVSGLNKPGLRV